jgi:hypothetical protein
MIAPNADVDLQGVDIGKEAVERIIAEVSSDAAYAKTPGAPVEVTAEDVQLLVPRAPRVKDVSTRW